MAEKDGKDIRGEKEVKEDGSSNWKTILLNGSLILIGAIVGAVFSYLGTRANAQAQVAAAQEAARAEITSMAISVLVPMQATQTAEARATPAPMKMAETHTPSPTPTSEPGYLEIEQIPQQVFVFAGNNNPDGGYGTFDLIYEQKAHPVYQMTYSLPTGKYGYAGLVFQFPDGANLSEYRGVEFTLHFKNPGDKIELYIRDIASHDNTVLVGGNGQDEMKLSYAFSNFPDINFSAVKEIGWIASTTYATGDHQVQVKDVRLVK